MKSMPDYSCEIMSILVLVSLSAASHFWYIMLLVCLGAAVWGVGVLAARSFQYLRAMLRLEQIDHADAGDPGSASTVRDETSDVRRVTERSSVPITSQLSR